MINSNHLKILNTKICKSEFKDHKLEMSVII